MRAVCAHDRRERAELKPARVELAVGALTGAQRQITGHDDVAAGAGRDRVGVARAEDIVAALGWGTACQSRQAGGGRRGNSRHFFLSPRGEPLL